MAQIRLRKDFYGTKIPKVSSDSIRVTVGFDYKGPAQTLDIESSTGKRGIWGDYDQESPTYHDSKSVYKSETFRPYTFSRTIPLSFWGDRQIDDCAVEVVISGEGVYDDAVLWDAYTVNLVAVGISFSVRGWGFVNVWPDTVKCCCYYYDPGISDFVGNGKWYGLADYIRFTNVQPGGYLAAFCLDKYNNVSPQVTSYTFTAVDGGIYQFDLYTKVVTKIG